MQHRFVEASVVVRQRLPPGLPAENLAGSVVESWVAAKVWNTLVPVSNVSWACPTSSVPRSRMRVCRNRAGSCASDAANAAFIATAPYPLSAGPFFTVGACPTRRAGDRGPLGVVLVDDVPQPAGPPWPATPGCTCLASWHPSRKRRCARNQGYFIGRRNHSYLTPARSVGELTVRPIQHDLVFVRAQFCSSSS